MQPINVEEHLPTHEIQTWISNKQFALLTEDRQTLLDPVGWLNTSLISAAQILLREQFDAKTGLQDPCLAQSMGFKVVSDEFVQIVHNGLGHWLTVTNIGATGGAEVMIYDSLYPSINTFVQKQIAAMMKTTEAEIRVNVMDMQMQAGTCDCGLFSIATAAALLNGVHPGECTFNQSRMRKHLYDCLNKGKITQFPLLKSRRGGRKTKYSETFSVYCDCRMPECSERDMVECSECLEWYHTDCVQVPQDALQNSNVQWYCHRCQT